MASHGAASDPVTVHEVARDRRERVSPAHHAVTNADKLRRGGRSRRLSSSVKTLTVSALVSAPRSQEVHTTWRLQFDNWGTRPTGRGATGMYLAWSRQIPAPQNTQEPTAGWARASSRFSWRTPGSSSNTPLPHVRRAEGLAAYGKRVSTSQRVQAGGSLRRRHPASSDWSTGPIGHPASVQARGEVHRQRHSR